MRLRIVYENELPLNVFRWTPKPYLQPLHTHSSLEIGCCISGKGRFLFSEKCYEVRPGDVFVVNHRELHIAESDPFDPSTYIFINFHPSLLLGEDESLLLPFSYRPGHFDNHIPAGNPASMTIQSLVGQLYEELARKEQGYVTAAKSLLLQICVVLLRYYSAGFSESQWNRLTSSFRKLDQVLRFMEEHFMDPIGLKDAARLTGLTLSGTSRFFQEALGRHFREHLTGLRVKEAKKWLAATDDAIADICFGCGFQSIATFYRVFKKETGLSPLEYRKRFGLNAMIENAKAADEKKSSASPGILEP